MFPSLSGPSNDSCRFPDTSRVVLPIVAQKKTKKVRKVYSILLPLSVCSFFFGNGRVHHLNHPFEGRARSLEGKVSGRVTPTELLLEGLEPETSTMSYQLGNTLLGFLFVIFL